MSDISRFLDRIGRNLDNFFESAERNIGEFLDGVQEHAEQEAKTGEKGLFEPGIRVQKGKEKTVFEIDLPGSAPSDVDVHLEGQHVVVSAQTRSACRERVFKRRFRVDPQVQPQHIAASLKHGMLTITVSRPQASPKADTIPVSAD